ncbi:hypothetical protein [Bacillus cereus]|uniref:hypothetical protein n=1 Tax=Bacillus cereus TaxID=1396 RepID=UPI000BEB752F|nr:hypothetical protein [Bacillus cereus]PEC81953.1 hypothetical protein CON28_29020 [Bacillus cereus]
MFSLLEKIKPTDSFNVWNYQKVKQYKGKVALYVFWDKKGYEQGDDRLEYEAKHLPVYIGKTTDLGNRLVEHLTYDKYTKDYSIYFYGVDVYVFENYCSCITLKGKNDCKCHPVLDKMTKDNMSYISLADIYELYFIKMMLPWFNETYNTYFDRTKPMRAQYVNKGYYLDRRSAWCNPKNVLSKEINEGFDEIDKLNKEWNIVKDKKIIRDEHWLNISEFVDELISKRNDENKIKLKNPLVDFIKNMISSNTFYMVPIFISGSSKTFDIVKGSGDDIKIASDALLFFSPPDNLIKSILS